MNEEQPIHLNGTHTYSVWLSLAFGLVHIHILVKYEPFDYRFYLWLSSVWL